MIERPLTGYSTAMNLKGISERIDRRLKAVGKSADAASNEAGKPDAIRNLRRAVKSGGQGRSGITTSTLQALAGVLRTTELWLLREEGPESTENIGDTATTIHPSGPEPSEVEVERHGWPQTGPRDLEVRGITIGGDDGAFYFGDVIDHVKRPPGIRNATNVSALNVGGDSMSPRFEPGELIYIQGREPAPGDYVVVELHPENEGDAPKSYLKRLVKSTGRRICCEQFNPKKPIEFDRAEVQRIWRVLTLRELLG